MAINHCAECLEKQRQIDDLKDEVKRLRSQLGYRRRQLEEGFFGSSTPSSKIPVKASTEETERKPRGARRGHKGIGRSGHGDKADRTVDIDPTSETCPECGTFMENKGWAVRSVTDLPPRKTENIRYRLAKRYCPHCRRTFTPQPPGVLPKCLYGNQLIADAVEMHYLHGMPIGRISQYMGIGAGSLVGLFRRCARLLEPAVGRLVEEYRNAPVKHADETPWRTDGKNGYVWLFATVDLSIFVFGENRSAKVPLAIFGTDPLPGVLVVDRYAVYNKVRCLIQYCFAHLLREIRDLEKEFPDASEIRLFVAVAGHQLAMAMGLRTEPISDEEFYRRAGTLRQEIRATMASPARHLGIRRIQDIFQRNDHRMYLWAENRAVPADNNLAERDLRPSVIARKVSFGSVTAGGAKVRSTLSTATSTSHKRCGDSAPCIKRALDTLAVNPKADVFDILFARCNSP